MISVQSRRQLCDGDVTGGDIYRVIDECYTMSGKVRSTH